MALVFAFFSPSFASDTLRTIRLENNCLVLGRGGEVGVWQAPPQANDTLGIGDVMYAPADFFKPWRHERFQFGYAKNPRWLRLDLTDTCDRHLILELDDPHIGEIRFFQVLENESMDTVTVGSRFPFGERKHPDFQFDIEVPANDTVRCYLHIPVSYSQLDFKLFLWDAASRERADKNETRILVVFFSLIFVYLLLLGLAINLTRFRYFWFYFLYVLLVAAYIFADLGLGFQHVWSGLPYVQHVSKPVLANAYLIAGVLFVLAHFNARRSYPLPGQTLRLAIYLAAGLMLAALALP
ncbi:MAG: 7TM-DISM domain-containing protein, partial [Bacteroidota bacterium]